MKQMKVSDEKCALLAVSLAAPLLRLTKWRCGAPGREIRRCHGGSTRGPVDGGMSGAVPGAKISIWGRYPEVVALMLEG